MKVGLVGLGRFHFDYHAPAILRCIAEGLPLELAICDLSQERISMWQEKFARCPSYGSTEALLDAVKLDAAYITVQPAACCEVVGKFLRAGIPCFTEKPPGITADETRRLAADAGKLPHAVGFNRRFSPVLRKLKEVSERQARNSAPLRIRCEFRRVSRYDEDFCTTLIHGIDAIRFLGGDFSSFSARSLKLEAGGRAHRNFSISGHMESGALVEMSVLPAVGRAVERYSVDWEGASATASLSMPGLNDSGEVELWGGGRRIEVHSEESLGVAEAPDFVRFGFHDQARKFFGGLLDSTSCGTSLRESVQSVEIADFLRSPGRTMEWKNAPEGFED